MSKLTDNVGSTMQQLSQSDLRSVTGTENGPQNQYNQNTQTLDESQEMGPLATKIERTEIVNSDITYYGIYIPPESQSALEDNAPIHVYEDKTDALKVVKRYRKARFKAFKSRVEAIEFATTGSKILNSASTTQTDGLEEASTSVFEKPRPKAQELVQFRKLIECGDLISVDITVWANPKYLISSGDTPAILQEGCRYNALHVAAKARNKALCEFIIQTVSDPEFVGLLYGDDDPVSLQERAAILLDLYLNTPDKGLNETPLHFAVKYGAVGVVEALVSYPQCDKNRKNKFGQTPKDIVCSRIPESDDSENLKKEIISLLDERFYVPVLRSEDNSVQPIIGTPFSPACPLTLNTDPINPRMEVHAYAGPMSHDEAVVFHKKWKTPPRMHRTPLKNCSSVASAMRLQDTEKGLERVGRELAQEFKVRWKEFWPFLGIFTDLSSPEGLQKLEVYLEKRFKQVFSKSPFEKDDKQSDFSKEHTVPITSTSNTEGTVGEAISPISDLCLAFKACSLSDTEPVRTTKTRQTVTKFIDVHNQDVCSNAESDTLMTVLANPGLSPFLYVEKSCQVFAKRISDILIHSLSTDEIMQGSQLCNANIFEFMLVEVKHLQVLVNSYMEDIRFMSVDFHLIHSRIASLVTTKIYKLFNCDIELMCLCLKLALVAHEKKDPPSSDEEDIANSNMYYRFQKNVERCKKSENSFKNHVMCLYQNIIDNFTQLEQNEPISEDVHVDNEDDCMKVWSDAVACTCNWHIQNSTRNSRKGASLKRSQSMKPVLITDVGSCNDPKKSSSLNCINRRLSYSECDNDLDVNDSCPSQNTIIQSGRTDIKEFKYQNISDNDDILETDVDETYYTPPTSPEEASSEEEMSTADEGIGVYIEGENPSKMDLAVLQAIQECKITVTEYPNVYRWKHLVLLHNEKERNSWASPATLRLLQKKRMCSDESYESSPRLARINSQQIPNMASDSSTIQFSRLRSNFHVD